MIDSEDNLERHDITDEEFKRDFFDPWVVSIQRAFAGAGGVRNVVHLRGALAEEKSPVARERVMGAFTERGEWVEPSPNMLALKSEPNTVLDVTLDTGKKLRVILTAADAAESSPDHFVVLKAA